MFAMALPTWHEEQTHEMTKAIIGAVLVEAINFENDVREGVASTLTDRDLKHILVAVDAVNNLKRLILTHCGKIRGHGLEPIRGSSTLVAIDLSLMARYESPPEDHDHSLSIEVVIPILDSVLFGDLQHIQLPKSWQTNAGIHYERNPTFRSFILDYNFFTRNCAGCDVGFSKTVDCIWHDVDNAWLGIQKHTCYDCLKNLCSDCNDDILSSQHEDLELGYIALCSSCQKFICRNCEPIKCCERCNDRYTCKGCLEEDACEDCWNCKYCIAKCKHCKKTGCYCHFNKCEMCEQESCFDCDDMFDCGQCQRTLCKDCDGAESCSQCQKIRCLHCLLQNGEDDLECVNCLARLHTYHT